MAFVVLRPIDRAEITVPTAEDGDVSCTVEEMGWLGVCPVVVTKEEALALTEDEELIIEIGLFKGSLLEHTKRSWEES